MSKATEQAVREILQALAPLKEKQVVTVCLQCRMCLKEHKVSAQHEKLWLWTQGALIQSALRTLSGTEREQLISNYCPACQDKIFAEPS